MVTGRLPWVEDGSKMQACDGIKKWVAARSPPGRIFDIPPPASFSPPTDEHDAESPWRAVNMPREAEPSQNEKAFVLQALEEKKRLDGREFDEYRPLELTFGDEHGVADVKLGKTR